MSLSVSLPMAQVFERAHTSTMMLPVGKYRKSTSCVAGKPRGGGSVIALRIVKVESAYPVKSLVGNLNSLQEGLELAIREGEQQDGHDYVFT
jgi:hypothetical protein